MHYCLSSLLFCLLCYIIIIIIIIIIPSMLNFIWDSSFVDLKYKIPQLFYFSSAKRTSTQKIHKTELRYILKCSGVRRRVLTLVMLQLHHTPTLMLPVSMYNQKHHQTIVHHLCMYVRPVIQIWTQ
jgi:flagellar biosynthesis protein FlhB